MADVYVATQSAIVDYGGSAIRIKKGVTRVESGHALLKKHPDLFAEAEASSQFRVRDTRGEASKYAKLKKDDLEEEIAKRNEDRADADKIVPVGTKNGELIAALEADDAAQG